MWSWTGCYIPHPMSYILYSHSILLPNLKFKRWKLLSQRMRTSRMNGIGVDSQVQMKSGCEKMFLPSLKTSAFFSIDVIRWYYVIDHTVKLGDKERFDKEQIDVKEPFTVTSCLFIHKDKKHLALSNNFRVTKKFLITKFDCTSIKGRKYQNQFILFSYTPKNERNICLMAE